MNNFNHFPAKIQSKNGHEFTPRELFAATYQVAAERNNKARYLFGDPIMMVEGFEDLTLLLRVDDDGNVVADCGVLSSAETTGDVITFVDALAAHMTGIPVYGTTDYDREWLYSVYMR